MVAFCILQHLGMDILTSSSFWLFLGHCMEPNPPMCLLHQDASVFSAATTLFFTQGALWSLLSSSACPALLWTTNYAHSQGDPRWPQPPLRSGLEFTVCCWARHQFSDNKHYYTPASCILPLLNIHLLFPQIIISQKEIQLVTSSHMSGNFRHIAAPINHFWGWE